MCLMVGELDWVLVVGLGDALTMTHPSGGMDHDWQFERVVVHVVAMAFGSINTCTSN